MAARPDILLAGQVPDIGATFRNALLNVQGFEGIRQARAQAERETQLQPLRERLLQAQVGTAEQGVLTPQELGSQRNLARLESVANFSQFALPGLQAGDIEGTRAALQQRRQSLQQAAAQGQQVDTTETDEALQLLDTNPQLLAQRMQQAIEAQKAASASGRAGVTQQKGRTVLVRQPDGTLAFSTNVFQPATGGVSTSLSPIEGELVSTLGETGIEQAAREVRTEVNKAAGKAGVKLRTEPAIQAAVTEAVSEVKAVEKISGEQRSNTRSLDTYNVAMKGLVDSLAGTDTGPFVGLLPALTSNQQIAEGAIAAMAPILKSLFRTAGEGTFTDKDQELLTNMVPSRKDSPEARQSKIQNIDAIIRAKLGTADITQQPARQPAATTTQPRQRQTFQSGRFTIEVENGDF